MTTIPNLNLIIQQSNFVLKSKNALHPSLEAEHLAALQQMEKERIKKESVAKLEEKEKIQFQKSKDDESRKQQPDKKKDKGSLLDTKA